MIQKKQLVVRKAAVLGAGVMGAQIAAQLINAKVNVVLFDLPSKEGDPNSIVHKAIASLAKLKPNPLGISEQSALIEAANFESDLSKLEECDFIIEAVAERLTIKQELYKKIIPYISEHAVLASNTSGLSINTLAESLPQQYRNRFLGVHFFNPPRYMHLVELIPGRETAPDLLPMVETFLVSTLGKGVVYAKDTPNFIANRVGVFAMLATMYHAQQENIDFEVVDALTGPIIGRPKSATFRTADVVGLDTMAHVISTLSDNLPNDPWHTYYKNPAWLDVLLQQGALGQKTGAGIYKKASNDIFVLDLKQKNYRPAKQQPAPEVIAILKIKNPVERLAALRKSDLKEAKFLWACFRDLFHYAAFHLQEIAETTRDVDLALRWGFGWQQGPFELWQVAGWQQIANWIEEDIKAGVAMALAPLPQWVRDVGAEGAYKDNHAYSPKLHKYLGRSQLAVYKRQLFPELVLGEQHAKGEMIFEDDNVCFWQQGDGIGIVSFKTKMNTINDSVLDNIQRAVDYAEENLQGLILWQNRGTDFSAGANLVELTQAAKAKGLSVIDDILNKFQQTALRLRYAMVPTIAAVRGRALGGGCELTMHCSRVVAAFETYIGLVEVGVGLLPAGGGTKEFAYRAALASKNLPNKNNDVLLTIQPYFKQIAMAEVSNSGREACAKHYLRKGDVIVMNSNELLYVAKQQIHAMKESGYRPPLQQKFPVAGKDGIATLKLQLVNLREGAFISEYDYFLGSKIAEVICGGYIEPGSLVDENWILRLEREVFLELISQEKTQQRIQYLLETGRPLRN
jgi:3-hydroxyacyl-CoA dehydrogenase